MKSFAVCVLLAAAELVAGHAAIIAATGDLGGSGMALGVDTTTPRDGTRRRPFQQDATRFRGDAADTVGETIGAGDNNIESGTSAIMTEMGDQLPQISQGGSVNMTLHQVNGDGGGMFSLYMHGNIRVELTRTPGPYTCMINGDGTATQWTDITVMTSPPGRNSRNRVRYPGTLMSYLYSLLTCTQDGEQTAFPLIAAIPENQECTGTVAGQENVCMVRCQNDANAGPFGGVVPVQMAGTTTPEEARRLLARATAAKHMQLEKLKRGL